MFLGPTHNRTGNPVLRCALSYFDPKISNELSFTKDTYVVYNVLFHLVGFSCISFRFILKTNN